MGVKDLRFPHGFSLSPSLHGVVVRRAYAPRLRRSTSYTLQVLRSFLFLLFPSFFPLPNCMYQGLGWKGYEKKYEQVTSTGSCSPSPRPRPLPPRQSHRHASVSRIKFVDLINTSHRSNPQVFARPLMYIASVHEKGGLEAICARGLKETPVRVLHGPLLLLVLLYNTYYARSTSHICIPHTGVHVTSKVKKEKKHISSKTIISATDNHRTSASSADGFTTRLVRSYV